jgi:hypothetical protein
MVSIIIGNLLSDTHEASESFQASMRSGDEPSPQRMSHVLVMTAANAQKMNG